MGDRRSFPNAEAADRIAAKPQIHQSPGALFTQLGKHAALDNPKHGLIVPGSGRSGSLGPAQGQGVGALGLRKADLGRRAFIEDHGDINPQAFLGSDDRFRGQQVYRTVQMGAKLDPLFAQPAQTFQA